MSNNLKKEKIQVEILFTSPLLLVLSTIATRTSLLANKYYHVCFPFLTKKKPKKVGCWQTLALQDCQSKQE